MSEPDPTRREEEGDEPAAATEFRLAPGDTRQQVWEKLRRHYEAKLASLRAQNDNTALDAVRTAELRGRIREVKNLLALGESRDPAMVADPEEAE